MVAPIIPGLTDHEMPTILRACAEAGALFAGYTIVRLPFAVAPQPITVGTYQNGGIVLTYHRPAGVNDVSYHVQVSTDLTSWSETGVSQQNIGTLSSHLSSGRSPIRDRTAWGLATVATRESPYPRNLNDR